MAKLNLAGETFNLVDTFDKFLTVPDCVVKGANKIGNANGEAKFYIASKEEMRLFFSNGKSGFKIKCFLLKSDLLNYMDAVKVEYTNPSQDYRKKEEFSELWRKRKSMIESLPEIVEFEMFDQTQIGGPRGYLNTAKIEDKHIIEAGNDFGYKILREIALPLISYVSIMQLSSAGGSLVYYWRLFVDYEAISEITNGALVFKYGRKKDAEEEEVEAPKKDKMQSEINKARVGQGLYREKLLMDCPFCPITGITDERLLIASHIKPWAASDNKEKIDPKNGFALSPMFDKLFDRGFITFTDDKHIVLSHWISPRNYDRIGIEDGTYYQRLPIDEDRKRYLEYHRNWVFKEVITRN